MEETTFKVLLTVTLAAAAAYFRELVVPLAVLVLVMAADYITGLAAAWVKKELSSRVGIVGIVKKIGYLFGVAVAVVADWIIQTAGAKVGMDLGGFYLFGLLVSIWMILNENISILENISRLGVPLPGFLVALVDRLKRSAEERGDDVAGKLEAHKKEDTISENRKDGNDGENRDHTGHDAGRP